MAMPREGIHPSRVNTRRAGRTPDYCDDVDTASEVRRRDSVVITAKIRPPDLPPGVVERHRLTELLGQSSRVVLVAAPPGYGKTVVTRQHVDVAEHPVAWVSFDLFDESPTSFWLHVVRAVREVIAEVDEEAELVLREDRHNERFLAVLVAQIERAARPFTLILDDIAPWASSRIHDGITVLVERVGHLMRLIVSARADPPLPLGRWRANGWLVDVREDDLRLTDDEALAAAATFERRIPADTVAALNRHVEGWPIGLHLALVSASEASDPGASALALVRSDRLLADYVVAEVLDALPPRHREVALILSVVTAFDADLCHRLAGPDANDVVVDLERRRLVITSTGPPDVGKRFHRLLRELLESELRWRDPRLHAEAHRTAATIWRERGNVNAAYRHLMAAGDRDAANDIVIEPMLQYVDRGDRFGLAMLAGPFHDADDVDQPGLALDLATTWFFAGSEAEADTWYVRASSLIEDNVSPTGPADIVRRRLHAVRCFLALYHGDVDGAADCVREFEEHERHGALSTPVERRFPTVATRVALARGDLDEARRWLVRAKSLDAPPIVATVTVPALEAWFELLSGRLAHAIELAEAACAAAEHAATRPHHDVFDAVVVAARAQFAAGDLGNAHELAALACVDATDLGYDWNRVRAGLVSAQVAGVIHGPQTAIAIIRDVRVSLHRDDGPMHTALDIAEARALGRLGLFGHAWTLMEHVGASPPAQLVRAGLYLEAGRTEEVGPLLDDVDGWLPGERLEGDVLCATADATGAAGLRMRAAVEDAAASGWVSPFLSHGPRVDGLLRQLPLDRLHPALFQHYLPHGKPRRHRPVASEHVTARELTILVLLPSHLSYSQIGRELHLSVNTVKSNLKSIYRKLAVSNRSDAVDAARAAHLI